MKNLCVLAMIAALAVFSGCKRNPKSALKGQTNATLRFYGLVVDQDGQPLPGVTIEYHVDAYPKDWTFDTRGRPYEVSTVRATSGPDGKFEFDVTGCMLKLRKAEKPGYRHLYEMALSDAHPSVLAYRLISWSDPQYRSTSENPAVYVFVKDGTNVVATLPSAGGAKAFGKDWISIKPAWPREPSLPDVDLKGAQPRINKPLSLFFRAVDTDGVPMRNVRITVEVERHRTAEELNNQRHAIRSLRRTETREVVATTGGDGTVQREVIGFAIRKIRGYVTGEAGPGAAYLALNERDVRQTSDFYGREFLDQGEPIFRCDASNPILLVMVRRDERTSHVVPCRGGYELHNGAWQRVAPSWPGDCFPEVLYSPDEKAAPVDGSK